MDLQQKKELEKIVALIAAKEVWKKLPRSIEAWPAPLGYQFVGVTEKRGEANVLYFYNQLPYVNQKAC